MLTKRPARRLLRLSGTCDIARVPAAATSANDRVTVAAGVACSALYPASLEAIERAGMATTARALTLYALTDAAAVDHRVTVGGREYRVRAVSPWPWDDPAFVEMVVEDEG